MQKQTRGRASTIQTLPDDIKQTLDYMLADDAITQQDILKEINTMLDEAGVEKQISKSALNRYATRMETMGSRIRQAREVAEVWASKIGEKPTGEVSKVLIEMLRHMAFEMALDVDGKLDDEGNPVLNVDFIKDLALGVQRLELAADRTQKREQEIRKAYEEEKRKQAEKTLDGLEKQGGFDMNTLKRIRQEVYGIFDSEA